MNTYLAFVVSAIQTRFVYRAQVWASLFGELIAVLAAIAIWFAVYGDRGDVAGASLPDMITYAVIAGVFMRSWPYTHFVRKIGDQVKSGDVSIFLLKPLSYLLMLFSEEFGEMAFRLLTVSLPVTLIVGIAYGITLPPDPFHATMFVVFFALSFVLLFLITALFGLGAFWLLTVHAMEWFLTAFINILAGMLVPFWFFPAPFDVLLRYQPLAFVSFHPAAVYLGKTGVEETLLLLGVGLAWVAVLGAGLALLWRLVTTRLIVQGG